MRMEMLDGESSVKEEIKKQINDTIAEVRRISYNVMPQALVDFGLEAALGLDCAIP
jgi:signal transduction histidine kinase